MTYGLVVGINEDNLIVFVDAILVDPVGVKNPQVTAAPANTLLSGAPQTTLVFELVDTLANGLAVCSTWYKMKIYKNPCFVRNIPLGTGFLRLPRRTRMR
jgi:hypothetical protein